MAELPAMNWWADAYWADTRHLSLEEHGAYRTLLDIAWRANGQAIPDDDKRIAQMLGTTRARWLKLKPEVMAFWCLTPEGWVQKRLQKEWKTAQERREKARQKANARWNPKSLKNKGGRNAAADTAADANGYAGDMLTTHHSPLGSNEPIISSTEDKSAEPTPEPPLTCQEVVDAWNKRAEVWGVPRVEKLTAERRRKLGQRIKQNTLADFQKVFDAIDRSPFLRGENKRGWRANFDFILQPSSFVKALEGYYDH